MNKNGDLFPNVVCASALPSSTQNQHMSQPNLLLVGAATAVAAVGAYWFLTTRGKGRMQRVPGRRSRCWGFCRF